MDDDRYDGGGNRKVMTMTGRRISGCLPLAALVTVLVGCASPASRDRLQHLQSFDLLKQMQWLDRPVPDGFDFGEGGRDGYLEAVREEILRRMVHWPDEVVEAVRAHRAEIGMNKGQVVTAIGWPNEYPKLLWADAPGIRSPGMDSPWADDMAVMQARAEANQWSYFKAPRNLLLYFRDEKLDRIIDNREESGRWPEWAVRDERSDW